VSIHAFATSKRLRGPSFFSPGRKALGTVRESRILRDWVNIYENTKALRNTKKTSIHYRKAKDWGNNDGRGARSLTKSRHASAKRLGGAWGGVVKKKTSKNREVGLVAGEYLNKSTAKKIDIFPKIGGTLGKKWSLRESRD